MENKAVIRTLPSAKNDDRDELVKVFFCSIIKNGRENPCASAME